MLKNDLILLSFQDILDRHISKTIDTLGEDDCNYYRPVSQESYDDFDLPPPPRLADMRWCITTPNNNGNYNLRYSGKSHWLDRSAWVLHIGAVSPSYNF